MKPENAKNQWGNPSQHERQQSEHASCVTLMVIFENLWYLAGFKLHKLLEAGEKEIKRSLTFLWLESHAVSVGWCVFSYLRMVFPK